MNFQTAVELLNFGAFVGTISSIFLSSNTSTLRRSSAVPTPFQEPDFSARWGLCLHLYLAEFGFAFQGRRIYLAGDRNCISGNSYAGI